jgi:hypothetical protein
LRVAESRIQKSALASPSAASTQRKHKGHIGREHAVCTDYHRGCALDSHIGAQVVRGHFVVAEILKSQCSSTWSMIRKSLKSPCCSTWRAPRHRDGRHSPPRPPNIKARSALESTTANPMYARAGGLGFPEITSTMRQKSSAILKMCTSSLNSARNTIASQTQISDTSLRPQRRHRESVSRAL